MSIEDAVDEYLKFLKNFENLNIISARQSAVDCINLMILAVETKMNVLITSREGLLKAKKASTVANPEQLEKILEAVQAISEALKVN